ncbi:hypothetical protein HPB49_000001 [Dermacentor silvarum]|uniref:Uncharacterized protein n=1 Tax=Dermacentor silvarum TaxID=543639 RepID=A0ACB8CNQ5_DERSI|nr:hypothetical protein HPB49_000001 [Dermacentor silvarum]
MADAETDEQRFVRELRRLLDEPDDVSLQEQKPQYRIRDDPSIAATRNLLRACQEAQGIGLRTVAVLESQGEQLDNVSRALDNISADLDSAEGNLSQMRRPLFGLCPWRCRWKKKKDKKDDTSQSPRNQQHSEARKPRAKSTTSEEAAAETTATARFSTTADGSSGPSQTEERVAAASGEHRGVDSASEPRHQRPSEADELGAALTGLKGIAQAREMGQQLSAQNEQVDELTASAASSEERIRRASQQADKILRDA